MVHDLNALRVARHMALQMRGAGLKDKRIPEEFAKNGIDPELAPIVLRQLDVQRAVDLAANGRRDIHYGLLTAGASLVAAIASIVIPVLPLLFSAGIAVGLGWMARGVFHNWRAESLAAGVTRGSITETFGGHLADQIKTTEEVMAERAGVAVSLKRARTNSLYFTYLFTAAVGFALFGPFSTMDSEWSFLLWVLTVMVVFLGALFASAELLTRAEGLPPPRPFQKRTPPPTDEPVQRYAAVRFSEAPDGGDDAVVFAPAHDDLPPQNALVRSGDENIIGVLLTTTRELAFLPDVPLQNPELAAMGRVAGDMISQASPLFEIIRDIAGETAGREPETYPEWLTKALEHEAHFVIAWSDLVETGYDPATRATTLVKDDGSGERKTFALTGLGNLLAAYLFNLKLRYERNEVIFKVAYEPKYNEVLAELTPPFKQLYGDDWVDHSLELHKAVATTLEKRLQNIPIDEAEINRVLAPLRPTFASTPAIVMENEQLVVQMKSDAASQGPG